MSITTDDEDLITDGAPAADPACRAPAVTSDRTANDGPTEGTVWLCRRIAQIPLGEALGLEHWWLMTPDREAGMGPCGGGVPGAHLDLPYITKACVNDHTGEHLRPDVQCEPLERVDSTCVDQKLNVDRPLGRWTPTNQCQTFVQEVLDSCKPDESLFDGSEGASSQ